MVRCVPGWTLDTDSKFNSFKQKYLTNVKTSSSTKEKSKTFQVKVVNLTKGDLLNARTSPSLKASIGDKVGNNVVLTIIDTVVNENITWYVTKSKLYVSSAYCKKI